MPFKSCKSVILVVALEDLFLHKEIKSFWLYEIFS